jgi:hypothetical protein
MGLAIMRLVTIQQSNCGMDGSWAFMASNLPRVLYTRGIFMIDDRV